MSLTLILGGARSGKSRFAQAQALARSSRPVYLATSRVWDEDHARRIARHRQDRGPEWRTIEEPLSPASVPLANEVVVFDCVTLWLANFFSYKPGEEDAALKRARAEIDALLATNNTWIVVSNELGMGVHAATEAGRKFADLQGFVNQYLASRAELVVLMVAGLPLTVKGSLS